MFGLSRSGEAVVSSAQAKASTGCKGSKQDLQLDNNLPAVASKPLPQPPGPEPVYVEMLTEEQVQAMGIKYQEDGLNPDLVADAAAPLVDRKQKPSDAAIRLNDHDPNYVVPDPIAVAEARKSRSAPVAVQKMTIHDILVNTRLV